MNHVEFDFLDSLTDFNLEARYPDFKLEAYKKATKVLSDKYLQRTKELYLWLKKNDLKNVKNKAISFIDLVKTSGIPVKSAFIFGSYAKGKAHKNSDIDICLVSTTFSDRFNDRLRLMRLRRKIDFSIEPHPFHPDDFVDEDPLVWEIKKTGIRVI